MIKRLLERMTRAEAVASQRARPSISHARRNYLTDRAVRHGDQKALSELARNWEPGGYQLTKEQCEAAIAAGLRADTSVVSKRGFERLKAVEHSGYRLSSSTTAIRWR